jgi:hypothetical protein
VRRLIALLVVSLLGAGAYGVSGASSGVVVNGQSLAAATLREELRAISGDANISCHLSAVAGANFSRAAGDSVAASGASAWTSLRVEGLAVDQYVTARFGYHPSASALSQARNSLVAEMTQAATSRGLTCPGTAAQALAAMPAEMRSSLVTGQADSTYLVSRLSTSVPLTVAGLQGYYTSHLSDYDRLCVAIAVVSPARVPAFEAAATQGLSVAALAKEFSVDSKTASKGGAAGCFDPTSPYYAGVRADVGTAATGHFNTNPHAVSLGGSTYALFVAVVTRTTTSFTKAASAVYSDVQSQNSQSASTVKSNVLYRAAVAIDPAFGRWGLGSSGPGVFAPATPAPRDVANSSTLASPSALGYQ